MAEAIQDKNNPNIWREGEITIIKIPELGRDAEMRFNFNLGNGVELGAKLSTEERHKVHKTENLFSQKIGIPTGGAMSQWEKVTEAKFTTLVKNDRSDTEKLLDKMFNHPEPAEEKLQHDFNQLIVKTYTNNKDASGKPVPLDVGGSEALTASEFGGALLEEKGGQPALGINLNEMKKANYIYHDKVDGHEVNKNHAASLVDIFRHELFHYIDANMQGKSNGPDAERDGESRAVWYVNQFQAARGEPKRASYTVTNKEEMLQTIAETPGVLGDKMPNGDAPSINHLRTYTLVKSEGEDQKVQPQSNADTELLPGLAALSTASDLFLSTKSGLLSENQARIQSIIDGRLTAHNVEGKDITVVINDSEKIEVVSNHEFWPKLG